MWTRAELKENAKKFFKFNYWKMVLVALVMSIIGGGGGGGTSYSGQNSDSDLGSGMGPAQINEIMTFIAAFLVIFAVIMVIAYALDIFVFAPLRVGAQRFFVVSHYQKAELNELGFAFKNSYMNIVKTMFFKGLYTFLWSLLLIIPGIIKSYEYRMIPYILAENPDIETKQAFEMSKQMMTGNKWDAFVLDLSFLGWILLSVVTCGILAIFWTNPYIYMTDAELYVALKEITYGSNNTYNNNNMYTQDMNGQWNNPQV